MATLLIRNLENGVKESLRVRAAQHGRSMEAEARAILEDSVIEKTPKEAGASGEHFYLRVRRAVERYGGVDLKLPPREPGREPLDFSGDDYKPYDE